MALDRLRFHNILVQEMDAPSDAATELAEVVDESMSDLVTKQDLKVGLEQLRLEVLAEMQSRFNSHLRWVMTMWGSAIAAIVALAVAIIVRGS